MKPPLIEKAIFICSPMLAIVLLIGSLVSRSFCKRVRQSINRPDPGGVCRGCPGALGGYGTTTKLRVPSGRGRFLRL